MQIRDLLSSSALHWNNIVCMIRVHECNESNALRIAEGVQMKGVPWKSQEG